MEEGEGEEEQQLVHCGKGAPSGLLIGYWILSAGPICTAAARSARSGEALWGSYFCFEICLVHLKFQFVWWFLCVLFVLTSRRVFEDGGDTGRRTSTPLCEI